MKLLPINLPGTFLWSHVCTFVPPGRKTLDFANQKSCQVTSGNCTSWFQTTTGEEEEEEEDLVVKWEFGKWLSVGRVINDTHPEVSPNNNNILKQLQDLQVPTGDCLITLCRFNVSVVVKFAQSKQVEPARRTLAEHWSLFSKQMRRFTSALPRDRSLLRLLLLITSEQICYWIHVKQFLSLVEGYCTEETRIKSRKM